jgi:hypothetical protein
MEKTITMDSDEWEAIIIAVETTIDSLNLENDPLSDLPQIGEKLACLVHGIK